MHNEQRLLFRMVMHDIISCIHTDYAEDLVSIGVIWSLKRNMKPLHNIARRNLIRCISPSSKLLAASSPPSPPLAILRRPCRVTRYMIMPQTTSMERIWCIHWRLLVA